MEFYIYRKIIKNHLTIVK